MLKISIGFLKFLYIFYYFNLASSAAFSDS